MKTYDLIIIGSGSMGAAGGYYASRSGLRTLLIDAHTPPHDQGAHHGQTRLYRYLYHNEAYQSLLNRAAILWPQLEGTHHARLLTRCGVANIAAKNSESLACKRDMAERYALPYEWLEADAVAARWPGLRLPADSACLYESEAGYLHSESAVRLFLEKAQQHGADTAFNQTVTRIAGEGETIRVECTNAYYHARRVALCAGTWANNIAGLGLTLPFAPVRKTFAWYDVPTAYQESHGFPGFTAETADGIYYGFPDSGDGLKVGRHDNGEIMREVAERYPYGHYDDRCDTDRFLQQYFPQAGALRDGKVCSYDRTATEDFIISLHPKDPRILILSGFSGHGFKFVPAVGEQIARFAAGESLPAAFAPFFLK